MPAEGLTVAVTGPTGGLGSAVVAALERARSVKRIIGMARRPFDPAERGWKKTEYREGDVQDAKSVREFIKGADVVVHLAFSMMGEGDQTRAINVDGSRNVFEAAIKGGAERICYASSVAAYGFADDLPDWLTEDIDARGTPEHFYSAQKAEVEALLGKLLMGSRDTHAWVFRPSIIAGANAQVLLDAMPYFQLSEAMPGPARSLLSSMPILKPVLPDPGIPIQLVHEDDVAAAFIAGVRGKGEPGPYNLAAGGTVTMSDIADELGWYALPVPDLAIEALAEIVSRLPLLPESASWVHSLRRPSLMKTDRARKRLGWRPKHTAKATLREMVAARRDDQAVR